MKQSLKTGLAFGITSGIITTLGLMVGLSFGTHLKIAVIGGILTIAVADAFSDALGIHIAQESDKKNTSREVWESTIATFVAKFFMAMTFVVPVLVFSNLLTATIVSAIRGLLLLGALSWRIARKQHENPLQVIREHVGIAVVVIVITYFVGVFIANTFGSVG